MVLQYTKAAMKKATQPRILSTNLNCFIQLCVILIVNRSCFLLNLSVVIIIKLQRYKLCDLYRLFFYILTLKSMGNG